MLVLTVFCCAKSLTENTVTCCRAHLIRQGRHNTVGFFSTALLQKLLDATGTPGTQGGLLIYTPAQGKALCPPGIGQSAGTLICMHPLRRGWRQIRASVCAVVVFMETVYWRLAPTFRHRLPTINQLTNCKNNELISRTSGNQTDTVVLFHKQPL